MRIRRAIVATAAGVALSLGGTVAQAIVGGAPVASAHGDIACWDFSDVGGGMVCDVGGDLIWID
jgi:hypothetical protein